MRGTNMIGTYHTLKYMIDMDSYVRRCPFYTSILRDVRLTIHIATSEERVFIRSIFVNSTPFGLKTLDSCSRSRIPQRESIWYGVTNPSGVSPGTLDNGRHTSSPSGESRNARQRSSHFISSCGTTWKTHVQTTREKRP
jgi:hypothetical protein